MIPLGRSCSHGQQSSDLLLNNRPGEKVGIHPSPECRRISEDEIAKLFFGDDAMFNQLIRLFGHFSHIGHIPVANIGAVNRSQLRPKGIRCGVKGRGIHRIIRLAAKIKMGNKEIANIFVFGDVAAPEVVLLFGRGFRIDGRTTGVGEQVELACGDAAPIPLAEIQQLLDVQIRRVIVFQRCRDYAYASGPVTRRTGRLPNSVPPSRKANFKVGKR